MSTTLVIFLLSVGTLALWGGRAYVQFYAGVPPTPWLVMEMVFAAGPAFGWWCHSNEGWAMWIALPWAICGIVALAVSKFVLNQYQELKVAGGRKSRDLNECESEADPMVKALNTYKSVDRSFDFNVVERGERLAESRRNRISAVS
jgi:hypothetical protein